VLSEIRSTVSVLSFKFMETGSERVFSTEKARVVLVSMVGQSGAGAAAVLCGSPLITCNGALGKHNAQHRYGADSRRIFSFESAEQEAWQLRTATAMQCSLGNIRC
jgi:hypothetical protein